jgi:GNAT superfamily N-acetyltransferase
VNARNFTVRRISLAEATPVRKAILRRGTPAREAQYEGDEAPETIHLGVERDSSVIATSTWIIAPWPENPGFVAVQLRGMAVTDEAQNTGIGRALIDAGIEHARAIDARFVWAKARDSALYFYERCGFSIVGDQFLEPASGVPHHLVVLDLH